MLKQNQNRLDFSQPHLKVFVSLLALGVYLGLFGVYRSVLGFGGAVFGLLPILVFYAFWGWIGGIGAGVLAAGLNLLLLKTWLAAAQVTFFENLSLNLILVLVGCFLGWGLQRRPNFAHAPVSADADARYWPDTWLLSTFNQIILDVNKMMPVEDIFRVVGRHLRQTGISSIILTLDDDEILTARYLNFDSQGFAALEKLLGFRPETFTFSIKDDNILQAVVRERSIYCHDNVQDVLHRILPSEIRPLASQILRILSLKKVIVAPLVVDDVVAGVLVLFSDLISDQDLPLIQPFAYQLAAIWQHAKLTQALASELEDRQNYVDALADIELRYRSLFDSSNDAIFIVRINGTIVGVNQQAADFLGYERAELIGLQNTRLVLEDEIPHTMTQYDAILKGGQIPIYERQFKRKDGSIVVGEVNVGLVYDTKGEPIYIQSLVRDVTRRKRSRDLLLTVNRLALVLQAAKTQAEIFSVFAAELAQLAFFSTVFLFDAEKRTLFLRYTNLNEKTIKNLEKIVGLSSLNFSFPIEKSDVFTQVVAQRETIFTRDLNAMVSKLFPQKYQRFTRMILNAVDVDRIILTPLIVQTDVIGVMAITAKNLGVEDVPSVTAFGYQIAMAWRRIDLVVNLERELLSRKRIGNLLRGINMISFDMQMARTPDEIFTIMADGLTKINFLCAVFLMDADRTAARIKYTNYNSAIIQQAEKLLGIHLENFTIPVANIDIYKRAIFDRETFLVDDPGDLLKQMVPPRFQRFLPQLQRFLAVPSFIITPVIVENDVIGFVTVQADDLTTEDIPAINAFSNQVSVTWRKMNLMESLEVELAERKKAEDQFRSIFENAVMGLYRSTPDGQITMANPALIQMLQFDSFEALTQRNLEHEGFSKEYSRNSFKDEIENQGLVLGLEGVWQTVGGDSIYVRENAKAIKDQHGNILYYEGTVEDITQQKQIEFEREELLSNLARRNTQLQTAAQISKFANTILDPNMLITQSVSLIQDRFGFYYVGLFMVDEQNKNAVLQAGTGIAGRQMVTDKYQLPVEETSMIGWCITNSQPRIALDVGKDAVRFENPYLPKTRSEIALPLISRRRCIGALTVQSEEEKAFTNEDIITLQVMAEQLAIAIDNARLYEMSQQEIVERIVAENEVRILNQALEQRVQMRTAELQASNSELEAFAYSVSHDLRAPLRAIDGFSQALLEDYNAVLDAEGQDYLHRVRRGTQRMGELIDDILKLSRIARHEMQLSRFNLSELVTNIAVSLNAENEHRQIKFIIATGLVTTGDQQLISIALQNLLTNAVKYTANVQVAQIEFGLMHRNETPFFFVKDNGAGFNMEYIDKLFVPFQRLHNNSEFSGSGIGLSIVSRVIHKHGGEIFAEAEVDRGACFYFSLGQTTHFGPRHS